MEKKEFAVGEEFQFGLKRLRVEKDTKETPCMGCVFCSPTFLCGDIVKNFIGQCMGCARTDKTSVIFVEVK